MKYTEFDVEVLVQTHSGKLVVNVDHDHDGIYVAEFNDGLTDEYFESDLENLEKLYSLL